MGDRAVLLDLTAVVAAGGAGGTVLPAVVADALRGVTGPDGEPVVDVVPAAATVLVRFASGPGTREPTPAARQRLLDRAAAVLTTADPGATPVPAAADELVVPVRYDGPDLAEVAAHTGLSVGEVIAAHTGTVWTAAFVGFAPGFAYLTGGDPRLQVPRREQSRTSIPAGSVALAGEWSAVYPRQSPGGWQLIGTTDLPLWDESAEPPARIRPGQRVRFVPGDSATTLPSAPMVRTSTPYGPTALQVVRSGPRALLQDSGRQGRAADGVGPSGPIDRAAHDRANHLVGNPSSATAIECTLGGLMIEAERDLVVAVTGAACVVEINGLPVDFDASVICPAGSQLRLRAPRSGVHSYLAVMGGLMAPTVLGSSSTDTLANLGPAPLQAGTRIRQPEFRTPDWWRDGTPDPLAHRPGETLLPVRFGPRDDWFTDPAALLRGEWVVSPQSNRVALRLDRPTDALPDQVPPLTRSRTGELPSEGLVRGAIQVPPSGQPVLFLADHPLTGGYPVIAVVLDDDVDRAGQLRPGQRLRFSGR